MVQTYAFKKNRGRYRGFTLVEILVVVFLIVLLSSLLIVGISYVREQGRINAIKPFEAEVRYQLSGSVIGDWRFDEGAGLFANDSSGNGFHGAINGAVWQTQGQCGLGFGSCLEFDGSNAYISVPDHPTLSEFDEFTVAAWIKIDAINPSDQMTIVGHWNPGSSSHREFLLNIEMDGRLQLDIGGIGFVLNGSEIPEGRWTHVVAVSDFINGDHRLYINGKIDAIRSGTPPARDSPQNLSIGARIATSADVNQYFNGLIDQVVISRRTLTTQEIKQLYAKGAPLYQFAQSGI